MNIIENEISTTQMKKQYVLSEEEYQQLINNNRRWGYRKVKQYILFCVRNYTLKLNIGGTVQFMEELIDFLTEDSDYISNHYGYDFWKWLDKGE